MGRISFDKFESTIRSLKIRSDLQYGIDGLCQKYNNASKDMAEIWMPDDSAVVVDLLEEMFDDKSEWISYWVYELNFGEKYRDGCVTEQDGTNIPLETIKDLWKLIQSNIDDKDESGGKKQ